MKSDHDSEDHRSSSSKLIIKQTQDVHSNWKGETQFKQKSIHRWMNEWMERWCCDYSVPNGRIRVHHVRWLNNNSNEHTSYRTKVLLLRLNRNLSQTTVKFLSDFYFFFYFQEFPTWRQLYHSSAGESVLLGILLSKSVSQTDRQTELRTQGFSIFIYRIAT